MPALIAILLPILLPSIESAVAKYGPAVINDFAMVLGEFTDWVKNLILAKLSPATALSISVDAITGIRAGAAFPNDADRLAEEQETVRLVLQAMGDVTPADALKTWQLADAQVTAKATADAAGAVVIQVPVAVVTPTPVTP